MLQYFCLVSQKAIIYFKWVLFIFFKRERVREREEHFEIAIIIATHNSLGTQNVKTILI